MTGAYVQTEPALDAIVVGAGFAGLYMVHKLVGLGLSVRAYETGQGVGGTWYWNRYPGARCDVESLQYSYSFSDALQQEWEWTERYPAQPELLRYIEHVADRFDLRRHFRFKTRVTAAQFDDASGCWKVATDRGETTTARFVVMATGALSAARKPDLPGLDDFAGDWFHTGDWPHEPVDFTDRRVAVIGTGSSGVQVTPPIAAQAEQLYILQRTPNFSIPAWNAPLPKAAQDAWKSDYAHHRAIAKATRSGALYDYSQRPAFSVDAAERRREFEARWQRGGANFTHAFSDLLRDERANETAAAFVREKIAGIVADPAVAAALQPTDHPIGTKRICVDTDYYATFNRPNVTLINVRVDPIESIGRDGVQLASGRQIEIDTIVFATGYDAVTGALARIDIRGRDGVALADKWADGPRTYLGLMSVGFPNLFTINGPGSPSILTNVVMAIEQHVEWIADCVAALRRRALSRIEPTADAEDTWVDTVNAVAAETLFPRAASWYMGANIPGKPRVFLPYVGGLGTYTAICREIAENDYRSFKLSA